MRRLLALTLLQRGLAVGVYLLATMILARLLTPAQVGVFSLAAAFLAIANVLREFGIGEYLMQEKQLDAPRIRAAFGVALVVGWAVGGAVWFLRHPIAAYYGDQGVADVLGVMALTFVFLPFATPMTALLYRDMAIARVLWIQTIALIVGHAASVTMAYGGLGYMSLAWGNVVNSACMVVILMLTRRRDAWVLPSLSGSRPIWDYCSKFAASGAFESGTRNVHEFVIGRRFGFADLGIYSRAAGLFVQFQQNVARGLSRVMLPSFAKLSREGSTDIKRTYLRAVELYTGIVWSIFGVVAVLATEVIRVMFGPQWSASAPLLQLLCLGAMVQCLYAFAGDLLGGLGQAGARLRITSMAAPLWVIVCLAAATISLQAIALATAIHATTVLLLYHRQLRRVAGIKVAEVLLAARKSLMLLLMVVGVCASARFGLVAWTTSPFLLLPVVLLLALATWLVGVRLVRHPIGGELQLLRQKLTSRVRPA